MYKLIALDIDGTLLNSEKKITNEVFNSIQEAKKIGAKVVLSTGRPLPGVTPLLDELNLNETIQEIENGVENTYSPSANTQKIFRDGHLLIIRDGKTYNAQGAAL